MGSASRISSASHRMRLSRPMHMILCTVLLEVVVVLGERDFNLNDSQVPLLEPREEPAFKQDPYVKELMQCHQTDPDIQLSLVLIDHDSAKLSSEKLMHAQGKLAKFFAIPKEFVSMDVVSKDDISLMQKQAMRKGGKSHKALDTPKFHLSRASFVIGCGGSYFAMGEPIAKQIAHQVKDGTIGSLTEYTIGAWFIWRKKLKSRSRRQTEGSGADDDYEYDEDDETAESVTQEPAAPTIHPHRHHHGVSELLGNSSPEDTDRVDAHPNSVDFTQVGSVSTKNNEPIESRILNEDIEESVSKLESVISKTIENTKNIKELPVTITSVDDVDEEDDIEPRTQTSTAVEEFLDGERRPAGLENEFSTKAALPMASTTAPTTPNHPMKQQIETTTPSHLATTPEDPLHTPSPTDSDKKVDAIYDVNPYTVISTLLTTNHTINTTPATSTTGSGPEVASSVIPHNHSHPLDGEASSVSVLSTVPPHESLRSFGGKASATSPSSSVLPLDTTSILVSTDTSTVSIIDLGTDKNSFHTNIITTAFTNLPSTTTTQPQTPQAKDTDAELTSNAVDSTGNRGAGNDVSTSSASSNLELSTTTFASTDYVEPHPENSPPIIRTRLPKQAVTSGKAFAFVVPEETFVDAEDKTNLRLELTDKDGNELKRSSWLQFDADKRELYGLPLDDTVSRWQYRLTATDSGNESVTETVEISVQQHRGVRTVNHEVNIAVRVNEKNVHNIDWQLKLLHAISRTLEDANSDAIVVREIRQTPQDPYSATFVYFNETLPTSICPEQELHSIIRSLDAKRLNDLVQPLLGIKSITGQLIGSCRKTELAKPKPTTPVSKNLPPMPRNQVDRVNASVGQLLIYKVPSDTFYDPNDNELTLNLKTMDHKELPPRHWLQFDSKNQEFYGIPKSGDTGSHEYLLVAEDSGGLSATDALVVVVTQAPKKDFSVLFKAYLGIRHDNFNADLQRKFVERFAQVHGNSNTNQIQIRTIIPNHDADGTIVSFYNTSLYKLHNRCPEREDAEVRSVYFSSDMVLRDSVKKALGSEIKLTNMTVSSCQIAEREKESMPPRTDHPTLKPTSPEEYLYTFILPAVIIVVMIILASIIACCLHRRRHKSGKMELGDEEERKSFRAKGIPVIFQDEFDEKPEMGNKSPVILKNEKPPLLPPSYNTSNLNGDNDVDEYVPPPAVVLGGREVRGKSPATPSYRKPPPYVSP